MNVVRHDHVCANHPPISLAPSFEQGAVYPGICESLLTVPGANSDENDCRSIEEDKDAFRWMASLRQSGNPLRLDSGSPYQRIIHGGNLVSRGCIRLVPTSA